MLKNEKAVPKISPAVQTAQDFINVKDISSGKLYTKDGLVFMFLRITPISIDLKTADEKKRLARHIAAEFGGIRESFKIIAVSRPLDLSPIINELNEHSRNADEAERKEVIRREKKDINLYMLDDNAVSRQFYLALWTKDEAGSPIKRLAMEMIERFRNVGVYTDLLSDNDIVQLCHVLTNPDAVHSGDDDVFTPTIPVIGG
jgi:hypothetical protein